MTWVTLNWSLVALRRYEGTWRASSETGVGGGRSHKAPFKFNSTIILFPFALLFKASSGEVCFVR